MKIALFTLSLLLISGSVQAMSAGEYVAKVGDCTACHSMPGGVELAGGQRFSTPIGDIYSTNITADKQQGIGRYSFAEFDRAMRRGVSRDGHYLYPVMPYTAYAKMNEQDMRDLYDYLLREVSPSAQPNRNSEIPWLLSMRWPLGIWNQFFHKNTAYQPDSRQSSQWNRGAYLVQGLGHCGSCHTPRGWAMQEQTLDDKTIVFLSGAELDGWYAASLRGIPTQEVIDLLKTGRNVRTAVAGPMAAVVTRSTQYLSDSDLNSIAVYLRSLPTMTVAAPDQPAQNLQAGEAIYAMYCSTCHGSKGSGRANIIPMLAGNTTLMANNPLTALRVILEGAQTPITRYGMAQTMPGYGWTLNDTEVANLMNYLRASWGNHAAAISDKQVSDARKFSRQ